MKLFLFVLGARVPGRTTEQHDSFFCVSESLEAAWPHIRKFWPEAGEKIHIDAWREVNKVENFKVTITEKTSLAQPLKLFFINLGGYEKNNMDELHYKTLIVAESEAAAKQAAKKNVFYKTKTFAGASSHIDDTVELDIDELLIVDDLLPLDQQKRYCISVLPSDENRPYDQLHIGYLPMKTQVGS